MQLRSRIVKPGFYSNEELAKLSHTHRLLFEGLWSLADREGRLEDRPDQIRALVFPYEPVIQVEPLLVDLVTHGFIARYLYDQDGQPGRAIMVINFAKHQSIHPHEAKSVIPACTPGCNDMSGQVDPARVALSSTCTSTSTFKDQNSAAPARAARLPFLALSTESTDVQGFRVLTKLAHEVYDILGVSSMADASDALKERAARLKIRATPDTFRKALDAALVQRRQKRG